MKTFVISDTHFGHQGSIEFEKNYRGHFKTAKEMDEFMIQEWNKVVSPEDTVIHLGDVSFKNHYDLVKRLNGKKELVFGNHDNGVTIQRLMEVGFSAFYGMKRVKGYFLTHCPMHKFELDMYPDLKNIHGHIHSRLVLTKELKPDTRYINVCVELTNFKPIDLADIEDYQKHLLRSQTVVELAVKKAHADIQRCNIKV